MSHPDFDGDGAAGPPPSGGRTFRRSLRLAVSAWLVFHLAAIILAPAAVGPSSDVVHAAWGVCGPYLEALYLNHGYHFFAPEPEESTLVSYKAERPDGTTIRGRMPDPEVRPRLLYHRYFMLTEHMRDAPEELQDLWYRSYAEQIGRRHGARRVSLTRQTHLLPSAQRIREGGRLSDPESYEDHPLGDFRCDD
ncbi:hypothetical protein OJF2_03990 [Aquisphaera giovannonii]|uniref:Uncharacterized protein n=1 Tax=Aquisphaera giovannonii TaxID=406548 RepID=A0A5B9VUI0_9BACT|nr:hypothetical protein [Aquisphaera giovannonii]QEH31932.1 hypothetical protein OJF2_03990 [Aquisphaera giovannonii]